MITKVSEIKIEDLKSYLRLTDIDKTEENYLNTIINSSISYVRNYTGLTDEELEKYNDIVAVIFILCQDLYDNRSLYVDKNNINRVVESILSLHSCNLLVKND